MGRDRPAEPDGLVAALLTRCTFDRSLAPLPCAYSGGADSTALLILAAGAGCEPVAHHVDHGLRATSAAEADQAARTAVALGVEVMVHHVYVAKGPNLEARARAARWAMLPAGAATGHTLDDQAETVLVNLLRGAGPRGLGAMHPSPRKPLLALRRHETAALCAAFGIAVVVDPSNNDRTLRRNRIRHDLLPLCDEIADRDTAVLLSRTAELCREDDALLDELAATIDPTDARALTAAPVALARRALRRWLTADGYPPSRGAVDRVLAVAAGAREACEIEHGVRIGRSGQRLRRIVETAQ